MLRALKDNKLVDFQSTTIPNADIIDKYAQYRFVLSPRGHGLDCHRTWEVILLGGIVITESSSLDAMFKDNDLPVIILKDFSELNQMSEEQLEEWYQANKHKTEKVQILKKYNPSYWLAR